MMLKIIPMKGKGHKVTARNLARGEEPEACRPLTTDPWDNAILNEYEEQKAETIVCESH